MSRQSPTSISTRIIMSFPGVPWQVWDTHRGAISLIRQWPVFKWGGWGSTTLSECHRMPVGSKELLNAEPEISQPPPPQHEPLSDLDSEHVQPSSAGNPVIYPLHLAHSALHFTFPTPPEHPPPSPPRTFLSHTNTCRLTFDLCCVTLCGAGLQR